MLFRMCIAGGWPHPDYLRTLLTCKQVADWQAYEKIEPFGSRHTELLNGINTAATVNSNGMKPPSQATDFMPSWVEPEMTASEVFEAFRAAKG